MNHPSRRVSTTIWKAGIPAVLVVAVAAYFIFRTPAAVELPKQLGELSLVRSVDGEKANEILDRMHNKEVTPATNAIGMYTGGLGEAVVYLSVYSSGRDASKAYTMMVRNIEKGNPLFTDYRTVRIAGIDASFCVGQGQNHYFFVYDNRLYWLAADSRDAEKMASELMKTLK